MGGVIVACLYTPNRNPRPGAKFEYKLAWMDRLAAHAAELLGSGLPVVLAGDYNVCRPPSTSIRRSAGPRMHCSIPRCAGASPILSARAGRTACARSIRPSGSIRSGTIWRYAWERDAGLRIDHLLSSPSLAPRLAAAGVDREVRGRDGASDHAPAWVVLSDDLAGI